MIQVYTGEGKGKTTASVGLAVRARGRGKRVLFVQFLKTEEAGEIEMMKALGIDLLRYDDVRSPLFYPDVDIESTAQRVRQYLKVISEKIHDYDLVVIDEFNNLLKTGILREKEALEFIESFPPDRELVITGRGATDKIIDRADYVTYFQMIKHPHQKGLKAREGIEY
jgi:cob(I)alamin adenosyltransferase